MCKSVPLLRWALLVRGRRQGPESIKYAVSLDRIRVQKYAPSTLGAPATGQALPGHRSSARDSSAWHLRCEGAPVKGFKELLQRQRANVALLPHLLLYF